jgi:mono/diheme cytochrome c family protein
MIKSVFNICVLLGLSVFVVSCKNDKKPNYQYMPNMYESVAYETYSESDAFASNNGIKGKEGQLPPSGTVKQGFVPYDVPNTPEGYAFSKSILTSGLPADKLDEEKGKELFNIYCAICHGEKGDGQGNLVKREKFLGVPSYKERAVSPGSVFHVITYGLNSMGSHANQLSQEERWQVVDYVLKLKSELK